MVSMLRFIVCQLELVSRGVPAGIGEVVAHRKGVRISNLLLVGVDHLQESVMAVVGPLRHVGSDDLDFYKYTR